MTEKERKKILKMCKEMRSCLDEMDVILDRMEKHSEEEKTYVPGETRVLIGKEHYA